MFGENLEKRDQSPADSRNRFGVDNQTASCVVVQSGSIRIAAVGICLLAIMGVLNGCVSDGGGGRVGGKPPSWVSDKDSSYPPGKYLAELGEGDSLRGAKANAAGAIAQIFRTRIQLDSSIRTRYTELTGSGGDSLGMLTQTDFDQTIDQSADESLSNLRYGESWTNDMGRVYTVAYLDRGQTGNLYRQRIMENDERVVQLIGRAQSQTEPLRRFAFLDAAAVMAEANQVLVKQLEIINMPMARSIMSPYEISDLRASRADQASALKIRIEVAGDDSGRILAVLSDWVTEKGFSVSPDGDLFLTAVTAMTPVKLNNDYENLTWEFNIMLMDSLGSPAISLPRKARSSGISVSAAESRAYNDMAEIITVEFNKNFNAYLASFLEK